MVDLTTTEQIDQQQHDACLCLTGYLLLAAFYVLLRTSIQSPSGIFSLPEAVSTLRLVFHALNHAVNLLLAKHPKVIS